MEISCLPVSLFSDITENRLTIIDWAQLAKKAGLKNIDLSCMFIKNNTPTYLDDLKSSLEKINMPIKMITTYPDFSNPDPLQRERELAYLKRDIAVASYLNVPYVRITAGQSHVGLAVKDGIESVVENFKRSAEFADKMNVTLVYENHAKPGAWHTVDFSYATDIFLEIAGKTEDTSIKINFDTANPVAFKDENEPMKILPQVINRLGTVHIADTSTKGSLNHTVIGTGLVPFAEIFEYLKKSGYDGLLSIEEGSNTGFDGIKTAVDFVKEMWGERN
ncbi:MAG: sugar phosphate isomerase/epimerase family protein [Acutalibacteraceae bacterium]|jgi:sugar phosphate isomerase/epimerase